MRILIVTDAWKPQVNGVVRTYEGLIPTLEEDGHIVHVIGPSDFPWHLPMPGYPEIELVLFPKARLRRQVEAFNPDTIHIATEGTLGWAMRALCLKNGWGFTTAYHTHFPDYAALRAARYCPPLYKPVQKSGISFVRHFHKHAAAVLTTTPSLDETLKGWDMRAPLHRLTRGLDVSVFHPGPATLFDDLKKPIALFVGRVAIEKNIGAFLEMDWPGSKVVVGDGPDLPALKKKFNDAHFAGRQFGQALADHYRSADIFCFPSKTDTFGIVLIEAMACGLPIAAYPVTGPKDVVTEQRLGAVCEDLSEAAQQALEAPGTREDRFQYVMEHYSWRAAADQFVGAQNLALIP